MKTLNTDFLIIGSGFGAAAPALRLCEAGHNVLMLEKGPAVDYSTDFKRTQDPKYYLKYLKGIGNKTIDLGYVEAYGGGSGFYEMVSLRAPSKAFDLKDNSGRFYWPAGITRSVMDTYYETAEQMLNVEQIPIDEIPKSGIVFSLLMKNLGYSCDRARYAVKNCVGSGYCISGCVFGAKQSLHKNYLPKAVKSGLKVLTETEASNIRSLVSNPQCIKKTSNPKASPYIYEVKCNDLKSKNSFLINAKVIILGSGTVGTAQLLLNSKQHLHFLSSQVGKNIAFNGSVKCVGITSNNMLDGDMFSGRSHPGMISYHFFDSLGITISSAKTLPLFAVSTARLELENQAQNPSYWGKANVELMKLFRKRIIILYALGLTPPIAEIRLDNSGIAYPLCKIDDETRKYFKNTKKILQSIFKRNGCTLVNHTNVDNEGQPHDEIHFGTTHMVGSCRMADNIENGVVDSFGEIFNYPNIFITDGAAIPTSLAVNSSLTILANAERISKYLVNRFS